MNIVISGNVTLSDGEISIISEHGNNTVFVCGDEHSNIPFVASEVDVVICNWFFKYHNIQEFTNLKYIQTISSGFNGFYPEDAINPDIVINSAKGVYSIPISEFVIFEILSLYKSGGWFYDKQRMHIWEKKRDIDELHDKKVLIVGVGEIGIELAKKMSSFTDKIYGCNRTRKINTYFKEIYALDQLKNVIKDKDIIILSIASTRQTKYLFSEPEFAVMKNTALIVNVSRGDVINQNDLIVALENGIIGGAILDVFEEEPLEHDSPLWDFENVMISPHNAFASIRNSERLNSLIMRNFINWREKTNEC